MPVAVAVSVTDIVAPVSVTDLVVEVSVTDLVGEESAHPARVHAPVRRSPTQAAEERRSSGATFQLGQLGQLW